MASKVGELCKFVFLFHGVGGGGVHMPEREEGSFRILIGKRSCLTPSLPTVQTLD